MSPPISREDVSKNKRFNELLGMALGRSGRLIPMKNGRNGLIPATSRKDEAMQELLNDQDPIVAALANARVAKKSEDQILSKLETLKQIANATGGYLPPFLKYYGGHTGRFAGGDKWNIQNLGNKGIGLDLRRLLVPVTPNHKFVGGDLAQVEARITAAYAGQEDLLQEYALNIDTYSAFATDIYHEPVRKPEKNEPDHIAIPLRRRREVGKAAVLGLGFSMGAWKFMNRLRADPATAPMFITDELSATKCREIVQTFRRKYSHIPQFWKDLEHGFIQAIDGCEETCGNIRFERQGDTVLIWLPSGRALRYPNARLESTTRTIKYLNANGEEDEFEPDGEGIVYDKNTSLYGGKLCENVVQATARDILVDAILRLESAGWHVLFSVHDEIIIECHESESKIAEEVLKRELDTTPEWFPGLPLKGEVTIMERYDK